MWPFCLFLLSILWQKVHSEGQKMGERGDGISVTYFVVACFGFFKLLLKMLLSLFFKAGVFPMVFRLFVEPHLYFSEVPLASPWDEWPARPEAKALSVTSQGKVSPWIISGIELAPGEWDCGPLGDNKLVPATCPPSFKFRYQIWTLTTVPPPPYL